MDANNVKQVSNNGLDEGLNLISLSNTTNVISIGFICLTSFFYCISISFSNLSGGMLFLSIAIVILISVIAVLFTLLYTAQSKVLANLLLTNRLLLKGVATNEVAVEKSVNTSAKTIDYDGLAYKPIKLEETEEVFCFVCREMGSENMVRGKDTDNYAHYSCLKSYIE